MPETAGSDRAARDGAAELWDWSLEAYGRPGVSEALIRLQDRHGADVNILLYCCWCAASGRGAVGAAELASLAALVAPWRSRVVEPLRAVRRSLKDGLAGAPAAAAEALRGEVKRAELDAERIEQALLAARAPLPATAASDPPADARLSATSYLRQLGVRDMALVAAELEAIVAGCCGKPPESL